MPWALDDLDEEITERHLDALVGADDSRIVDQPDWHQVVTPSFTSGGLNGVSRCRVAPALLTERVEQTLAEYARLQVPFRWTVTRRCTAGLAGLLRARAELTERPVVGLHRQSTPLSGSSPTLPVEQLSMQAADPEGAWSRALDAFSAVMAEGWSTPLAPLAAYNRRLLGFPDRQRLFLARVDGEPAGSAGLALAARSAYLIGAVVLPRFRHRGVYRALLEARLRVARDEGRTIVTCLANPRTSGPILEGLGFSSIGTVPVFHGRPPA